MLPCSISAYCWASITFIKATSERALEELNVGHELDLHHGMAVAILELIDSSSLLNS